MESAAMEVEVVRRNRDCPEIRASGTRQNQGAPSSGFETSFSMRSCGLNPAAESFRREAATEEKEF
jgi:hypothetical protein